MKILLCAMAFLILPLRLQAQEPDKTKLEENVYYRALVAVLTARAQDAKYATGNDPLHQVIIMRGIQLNIGFPSRVGELRSSMLPRMIFVHGIDL